MVITFKIQFIMKKVKFTTSQLCLVAVKIPLFPNLKLCKDFEVALFRVPFDFYNVIKTISLESFEDYPVISLSYYMYLLRFRRDFIKYIKLNVNNYE